MHPIFVLLAMALAAIDSGRTSADQRVLRVLCVAADW